METIEVVSTLTKHVNTFTRDAKEFNQLMSNEHRTLQQSFTRLCLQWIEHVANEEYRTDGRNEKSKEICKELIEAFKMKYKAQGFTDETLNEVMGKPSKHLSFI